MLKERVSSWRTKAFLQRVFSAIPGGVHLNWILQRYVTHSYPAGDAKLMLDAELARHHVETHRRYGRVPLAEAHFYEFGAGWDLAMPLLLYALGVETQTVIDIRPLARQSLVFDLARRLDPVAFGLDRSLPPPHGALPDYLGSLGIEYRAPADARLTGLATGTVDCITSTNTLEHIPPDDLQLILIECARILAPGGCCSFQVDYQDHYSYFDPSASVFNFLRFEEDEWRRFNPPLHYQSRLRHPDYLALYRAADLGTLADERVERAEDAQLLRQMQPLARSFRDRPVSDLAVRGSRVALRSLSTTEPGDPPPTTPHA